MKVAGLSIEGQRIRASIVNKRLSTTRVLGTDDITLSAEPVERDTTFKEALAKWKNTYGIEGIVVGLGLRHFSHQVVELPVRKREDIMRALGFEMEKYLPLEPDQYSFDFHSIETSQEGTKNLVFAVRKEKLRWIADCLKEAGLKMLGVRCTAIEAVNELLSTVNVSDAVLLYPYEDDYHIVGIKNSVPEFIKVVESKEEAAGQIEKLLESFGKTAYVASDKGTAEFERFNPRNLPVNMANIVVSPAARKRRIAMDFVPEDFATPKKDYYPYAIGLLCAACVTIFFCTAVLSYIKDYRAVKLINRQVADIKASTKQIIEMEKQIADAHEKLRFLRKSQNDKNLKIRILTEFSVLLPKDAWLTTLSADEKGKVDIEGFAKRTADIIGPLEGSPLVKDVEFSSPVTVREGVERFSLSMQVEQ